MAKATLSEKVSETTSDAEAAGDIIEGSPTATLAVAPGAGLVGDFDASDISFPKLQIAQGVGALSETYKKGTIVLDGETEISDGEKEVEITVCRIGKMFEENIEWDSGEIPRIMNTKAEVLEADPEATFVWQDGTPASWKAIADALVCIKGDNPDDFPFEHDGNNYAFAIWRIKGTAYKHAAVPIFTAAKMYYRDGINTGSFRLTTEKVKAGNNFVHAPKLKKGSKHDSKFIEWLKDFS
jgi:hypothetical protein